jgi:glucan-binding YG repeat protein
MKTKSERMNKLLTTAMAVLILLLAVCAVAIAYADGYVDMIRIVSMDAYDTNGYPLYYFKNAEKHGFRVDRAEEWLVSVQGQKSQYTANVYLTALDGYTFSMDETLTKADESLNAYLMEVRDNGRTAVVFVAGKRNRPSDKEDPLANVQEVTERDGESLMTEPVVPTATPVPTPTAKPEAQYGFKKINGYWYYTDGVNYKKGFVSVNEYTFFFDDDYRMHYGWLIIGEDSYYFGTDPNGAMLKNRFAEIDGVTYYFDENGKMKTGWFVDSARNTYFFATKESEFVMTTYDEFNRYTTEMVTLPKGAMLKNFWFVTRENAYYLQADGTLARNCELYGHVFDENGITPSRTLDWDEYHVYDDSDDCGNG